MAANAGPTPAQTSDPLLQKQHTFGCVLILGR